MPVIAESTIARVRQQASLLEVVQSYVTLKKQGGEYVGLSPFTNEKTPSFFVNPTKNVWYCYSSQQGGNVISFLQKKENLAFPEAIEALAQRFSIPIEYEAGGPREAPSLRKQLFAIQEEAAALFHRTFTSEKGLPLRDYWTQQRGFALSLAEEFKIGVADADGSGLLNHLLKKDFETEALAKSGLFYVRDGERDPRRFRPRFRGRLMVPIRDLQGRIVGFTARQTEFTPEDDPTAQAKYVNSPETPLFDKGRLLFNLDRARTAASRDEPFLMVEGQLDALRCWSEGFGSAVAPQGTSVTEDQLGLLRRYDAPVDTLLDGDAAGARATLRLMPLCVRAGISIRAVFLPEGHDPDSFLREFGPDALRELRETGRPLLDVYAEHLLEEHRGELSRAMLDEVFGVIDGAALETHRDRLLRRFAEKLDITESAFRADYLQFRQRRQSYAPRPETVPEGAPLRQKDEKKRLTTVELDLLCLVLLWPEYSSVVSASLVPEWIEENVPGGLPLHRLFAELADNQWDESRDWTELCDGLEDGNDIARILREKERFPSNAEGIPREINRCLAALCQKYCDRAIRRLRQQLANMTTTGDDYSTWKAQLRELQRLRLHPPQISLTPLTPAS